MKRISFIAILAIALFSPMTLMAQLPSIPSNIEEIEARNGRTWIITTDNAKMICYDAYDENSYEPYSLNDDGNYYNDCTKGEVVHGIKIGTYIYDCDDWGYGMVYVYNASDCKPVTISNYIPLKYGNPNGVKFSNGVTMYIVPFKAGKYSVTGQVNKKRLVGTYVLILDGLNSDWCPAAVNIRKTSKGYDLSQACGIWDKNYGYSKVISRSGKLLKNAVTVKGGNDMVCEPQWIVEYPGLCERGTPFGFIAK
ncbi:MAG: hypothetical protein IJ352_07685 [Muribaculaceae bacterium]|nr:hypothetical protein [Muribaculaceae bacterium]